MIYSGLDWSGSPGREQGPWLVFTVVHVDASDLLTLESQLAEARVRLGLHADYVFNHTRAKSSTEIHDRFYEAIGPVSLQAHVHVLDKRQWREQRGEGARGVDCLRDGIINLIIGCPEEVVANQVLFIDLPPAEARVVDELRTTLRKLLKSQRRTGFKNVRPCPDHRLHGAIIQVADMIAGEVWEHGSLDGPYLRRLGSRIHRV